MPRVLVLDDNERNLRILRSTLAPLGYEMLAIADGDRLRLEMRDQPPDLLLVSSDLAQGSGLDIARDAYADAERPVPVLVWSSYHSADALKVLAPVELMLAGVMTSPLDPGELVRLATMIAPPRDAAQAVAFIADLASDAGPVTVRLPEPDGTHDLSQTPVARLMIAVDHHDWSGLLELHLGATESVQLWFEMGQLTLASSSQGRDLIHTAQDDGRLRGVPVPEVPIKNLEEEAGLLMALRAIGMHEVEDLEARTAMRLVRHVLEAPRGRGVATAELEPPDAFSSPLALMPLLVQSVRASMALGPGHGIQAHPDSVLIVRLPSSDIMSSWALPDDQLAVIEQLRKAHNREISLDQFERVAEAAGLDPAVTRATLRLLKELGYVQFCGRPFDRPTTDSLDAFVAQLHRFARTDHFGVLGIKAGTSDKAVKQALHDLSRKVHPDVAFGQHPRVVETANALYARAQEAYEALKSADARKQYKEQAAETETVNSRRRSPERAKVAIIQGRSALKRKRYDEALAAFRDAHLEDPENLECRVLHGWTTYLQDPENNVRKGTNSIKRVINEHRGYAPAWYYLARVSLLEKDHDQARKYLAKALDADPKHVEAAREMRLLERRGLGSRDEGAGEGKGRRLFSRFRGGS